MSAELAIFNQSSTPMYTSMKCDTPEEKKTFFNAMSAPDYRLSDFINKEIAIKDVFFEYVDVTNEATGESYSAPRIVLTDVKGKTYTCVSVGIMSAIKRLFMVYGAPTWEDGIVVEVKQVSKGKYNMLAIVVK